jgi:hypothetical protein
MTTTACPRRCGECAACETYAVSTAVNALGLLTGETAGRALRRVLARFLPPAAKGLLVKITGSAMEPAK